MPTVTEQPHPLQELPPPYFTEQIPNPDQSVVYVVQNGGINLSALDGLDMFRIKRSGTVTAFALDKQNRQLFSYSESVIANNAYTCMAQMSFIDTTGREFIKVDIDMSSMKISNGPYQLGSIASIRMQSAMGGFVEISATSTMGQGVIQFVPEGGAPSEACCCCCCRCLLANYCCCFLNLGEGTYDILHNGGLVGALKSNKKEGTLVTFPGGLDSKAKALIVVGSFVLSNTYFKKN